MRKSACLFVAAIFLTSMIILPGTPSPIAQAAAGVSGAPQAHQLEIPPAKLRTMDDMLAFQAAHPLAPGAPQVVPFRPGMDSAAYALAKKVAAEAPSVSKPAAPTTSANPALMILNCEGEDQASANGYGFQWIPPDADGAFGFSPSAGTMEFAQTTNVHFTVWNASAAISNCARSNALLMDVTLASFFGYPGPSFLGDGRIVHDDTYNRWVVSALTFGPSEPSGADWQFIAVSVGDDARGPYFVYQFDTTQITCLGCFWDFDQLGMDDAAIILTANIFPPTPSFPFSSRWVFANKQHLYFGLGLTTCYFNDPLPSWAPPKVLDLNPLTWMVEAQPIANFLQVASVEHTGSICPRIVNYASVAVPAYTLAPSATQPGSTAVLDTLDARFQNRSTQVGNILWNVHTIALGPFPTPILRRIKTVGLTAQSAFFFASGTSNDWNPSVAANLGNTVAVSWSSDDPPAGVNAQVRAGRCVGAFGVCSPGVGTLVFQGSGPYGFFRWGDYSYAAIDGSGTFVGGVNEFIHTDASSWGTRYYVGIFP